MRIRSLQLINAPNEAVVHHSGSASYYPHLGLLSIATYVGAMDPDCNVEVIDGSITTLDEILDRIYADVIGISALTPTYTQALQIAAVAKQRNAVTVLGNDHATNLFANILARRNEVDYIICGDHGEVPLWRLIQYLRGQIQIEDVPNLAYRSTRGILVNRADRNVISLGANTRRDDVDLKGFRRYALDSVPIPDRMRIENSEVYTTNYRRDYGHFHADSPKQTTINIARGCGWGEADDRRCTFCDIYDLSMRTVQPERVWQEVRYLTRELGYTFLYEVCDSFSSFAVGKQTFVDGLLATKPADLNPEWFVYSRATELYRPGVIEKLKDMNVKRVNIGIDAADDSMLRLMSKGASDRINRTAVESCAKAGIQMYMSFVFGGIGETSETLERAYEFVEFAATTDFLVAIDPSVLLPLPNAPSWRYLLNTDEGMRIARKIGFKPVYGEDYAAKYGDSDILPTDELAEDWVATFCHCSYRDILSVRDRIVDLQAKRSFVFGGFGVRGF